MQKERQTAILRMRLVDFRQTSFSSKNRTICYEPCILCSATAQYNCFWKFQAVFRLGWEILKESKNFPFASRYKLVREPKTSNQSVAPPERSIPRYLSWVKEIIFTTVWPYKSGKKLIIFFFLTEFQLRIYTYGVGGTAWNRIQYSPMYSSTTFLSGETIRYKVCDFNLMFSSLFK